MILSELYSLVENDENGPVKNRSVSHSVFRKMNIPEIDVLPYERSVSQWFFLILNRPLYTSEVSRGIKKKK